MTGGPRDCASEGMSGTVEINDNLLNKQEILVGLG